MHWEIHPPRPSTLSGLGVQNPRPWEISRASGDVFPNTSLLSAVYVYNTALVGQSFGCHFHNTVLVVSVTREIERVIFNVRTVTIHPESRQFTAILS